MCGNARVGPSLITAPPLHGHRGKYHGGNSVGNESLNWCKYMDLFLFRRQVIIWILCTKFFLIGKFWQIFTARKVDKILFVSANLLISRCSLHWRWLGKCKFGVFLNVVLGVALLWGGFRNHGTCFFSFMSLCLSLSLGFALFGVFGNGVEGD